MEEFKKIERIFEETKQKEEENLELHKIQIIKNYINIITDKTIKGGGVDLVKIKEKSIYRVAEIFSKLGLTKDLFKLNNEVKPLFGKFPKVTTAKVVRKIIECVGKIPNTEDEQIELCRQSVEWAKVEKRTFLKQRIESRLASLYFDKGDFENSVKVLDPLLREVRKLDDKNLLVEIHLLESKIFFHLKNLPKSKAALVACRTAGDVIYVEPNLQGDLDTQSGITYSAEQDYKTSFSYFFEAFETYNNLNSPRAVKCLKYMLMCKIMSHQADDLLNILSSKNSLKYANDIDILAMKAVSKAYEHENLHEYEDTLKLYHKELVQDPILSSRVDYLYEELLERHLLKIIKPYSRVQISHVASVIKLDRKKIERKLSMMILDKKLNGILDQGNDCLEMFEESQNDDLLQTSVKNLDKVSILVDSLFDRAKKLEVQ